MIMLNNKNEYIEDKETIELLKIKEKYNEDNNMTIEYDNNTTLLNIASLYKLYYNKVLNSLYNTNDDEKSNAYENISNLITYNIPIKNINFQIYNKSDDLRRTLKISISTNLLNEIKCGIEYDEVLGGDPRENCAIHLTNLIIQSFEKCVNETQIMDDNEMDMVLNVVSGYQKFAISSEQLKLLNLVEIFEEIANKYPDV